MWLDKSDFGLGGKQFQIWNPKSLYDIIYAKFTFCIFLCLSGEIFHFSGSFWHFCGPPNQVTNKVSKRQKSSREITILEQYYENIFQVEQPAENHLKNQSFH